MTLKLLTEHHLEFLSVKGGCTDSSESTLVKMPHCWKLHVAAQFLIRESAITYMLPSTDLNGDLLSVPEPKCAKGVEYEKSYHYMGLVARNLFSGFPANRVSNQFPQLQRLARKFKFHLRQVYV